MSHLAYVLKSALEDVERNIEYHKKRITEHQGKLSSAERVVREESERLAAEEAKRAEIVAALEAVPPDGGGAK